MARRPLPHILSNGSADYARTQIARSRELARTAADSATDVLHPLITVSRGLCRLAAAGRRKWADTPKDKRGPLLFLVASVILVVALVPYGLLLAAITLMAAAAWQGRDRTPSAPEGPDESQIERLQSLYEALVPYFSAPEDPAPLYAHGGKWDKVFTAHEFDDAGRVAHLAIRYPAYFPDGEPEARARVEQLLTAKAGRGREYRFAWDEEGNRLDVTVLAPLPTDFAAQHFVTAPGETVLGLTDPTEVQRTLPLSYGAEQRDVPPVVWRTGLRSTEPHLLALGHPGSGTSTLLRSIALQALRYGDVLIVDGGGTGEYACLTGRDGVLAVECALTGALASLEWAASETERRLIAVNRARQAGDPPPEDTRRPLWIFLDRPTVFDPVAAADGRKDPQSLLQVPLRHGRAANVTVVVAEQFDSAELLSEAVRQHTRARVVLGPVAPQLVEAVLGAPPHTTPPAEVPPGRGYARLGSGPVHRLQVPSTPDPYDDATSETDRQAVLALLPARTCPADAAPTETMETVQTVEAVEPLPVEAVPLEAVDAVRVKTAETVKAVAAESS
ncbi:type IV secretory system conjugative DNA transfer family protein [Streptomyces sp. NK08204]|uniref:type IV secretory system conjugative DNA transfer family protein n=1 Tax=Streptomyces sp. NK08204 TaxID=2873260 RepID=UPI001CEC4BC8|nr:type IV secretory system conjugative DNA transfer family protein [Streptomyces sp. NK08204]